MKNSWQSDFERRTLATLQWLEHSIEATDYQGSAAYCHLWKGWSAAYPETTGYIIETLFDYAIFLNKSHYTNLASECAVWLCKIQNADGSFPGGIGTKGAPVVFDTGQILFGLTRTYLETGDEKFYSHLEKAVLWLMKILEPDGSWQQFAYAPGYVPAYYTRVIWAVIYANTVFQQTEIEWNMQKALDYYVAKVTPRWTVQGWGFRADEPAFTHTIAYTIRGFLESGHLLQEEKYIIIAKQIVNKILESHHKNKKLAGSYNENWQGDYSFECVTGNAQLTIILCRLYQITGEEVYRDYAGQIFQPTFQRSWLVNTSGLYGAVPGSAPLWGPYQRFKFPNWAAKFYLDAYLLNYQISA